MQKIILVCRCTCSSLAPSIPFLLNCYFVICCCVCSFIASVPVLSLYPFQSLRDCTKFANYSFKWEQSSPFLEQRNRQSSVSMLCILLVVQKSGVLCFAAWNVSHNKHCHVGNFMNTFIFFLLPFYVSFFHSHTFCFRVLFLCF